MKRIWMQTITAILVTFIFIRAQAQENLIYVAVKPCRIADTRKSAEGVINANTSRNFKVYGTDTALAVQGGQANCLNPKPGVEPQAVAAYIVAVPSDSSTGAGILTAYPSNETPPPAGTGATLNFAKGQTIGNTTIATLCNPNNCSFDGELAILARDTNEDVVIDVQGYFYPQGRELIEQTFTHATTQSGVDLKFSTELVCPEGKAAMSAGYHIPVVGLSTQDGRADEDFTIFTSAPSVDPRKWDFTYRVQSEPESGQVSITFYVVCESG